MRFGDFRDFILWEAHFASRGNHRFGALSAPALHVHGDGVLTDVGVGPIDVHGERRGRSAKSLGADAGLVDLAQQFFFEKRDVGIGVLRADLAEAAGALGQAGCDVRRATETDADGCRVFVMTIPAADESRISFSVPAIQHNGMVSVASPLDPTTATATVFFSGRTYTSGTITLSQTADRLVGTFRAAGTTTDGTAASIEGMFDAPYCD